MAAIAPPRPMEIASPGTELLQQTKTRNTLFLVVPVAHCVRVERRVMCVRSRYDTTNWEWKVSALYAIAHANTHTNGPCKLPIRCWKILTAFWNVSSPYHGHHSPAGTQALYMLMVGISPLNTGKTCATFRSSYRYGLLFSYTVNCRCQKTFVDLETTKGDGTPKKAQDE